jgi:SAM-dependent methyltransferase
MNGAKRAKAREIAHRHLSEGDALGWFEDLYVQAKGDSSVIPWADLEVNPNLAAWLDAHAMNGKGKSALKIGCGLGDDAEELARRGFDATAFDISETAVAWCRKRFPCSSVNYLATDLFKAPKEWEQAFDFVLESYTLQVLPPSLRKEAIRAISRFVRTGGTLLAIARGRDPGEEEGTMPWPLVRTELEEFRTLGLREVSFEDYLDHEEPPVRRFRVVYERRQQ